MTNLGDLMDRIFTTHTFGGSMQWAGGHTAPYKKILFEHKHLYSNFHRKKYNLLEHGEPAQTIERPQALNLDRYVFAYLGGHEYYYAVSHGMYPAPFGIFIHSASDDIKNVRVAKFDFASRRANENEFANMYNSPDAARKDCAQRIINEFNGDFFKYWIGSTNNVSLPSDENSWEWKIEFHYPEKVSLSQMGAILWPVVYVASRNPDNPRAVIYKTNKEYDRYRLQFAADHKQIKVYPYVWEPITGERRFVYASALVADLFRNSGNLPDVLNFTEQFKTAFPTI